MKNYICCFSGHRYVNNPNLVAIRIEHEIRTLIYQGVSLFKTGGALGFDTIAAFVVLSLKNEFPDIKLHIIFPCKNHDKFWTSQDKKMLALTKKSADIIEYAADAYYSGCTHLRNRMLVDGSGHCICYLNNIHSGTAYTVKYALQSGLNVVNLWG